MSLQINTLNVSSAAVKPKTPPGREFLISPALYGKTRWNLDNLSRMNISSSGQWTITPTSDFTASIKMWGAGGTGNDNTGTFNKYMGGAGGYSSGTASFVSGIPYVLIVGEAGTMVVGINGPYTIGGGGYGQGGDATTPNLRGGGLSGLFSQSYSHGNSMIIAGGGGAKNAGSTTDDYGGAGGGSSGQTGVGGNYGNSGGGTQTYGGIAATGRAPYGYNGSQLLGGLGCMFTTRFDVGSTGGGGGYYGGGGGSNVISGAAGGGSGYIGGVLNGITLTGDGSIPANSTDTDRGVSGAGGQRSGPYPPRDGRVIIS